MNIWKLTLPILALMGLLTAGAWSTDEVANKEVYRFPEPGAAPVISEPEVESILSNHGSELLVVNYWATWCGPCVAELPYFVKVSKEMEPGKVRFVGFSVDFVKDAKTVVEPFLKDRAIPYANFVLDVDPETFIGRVSKDWTGAVPATFFYDSKGNKVGEILGETDEDGLRSAIKAAREKAGFGA